MLGVRHIVLTPALVGLMGFARRSRKMVTGFEAVRRAAQHKKLALIIVDAALAQNSLKKVVALAGPQWLPVLVAGRGKDAAGLREHTGYKVVGIQSGGIAEGFIDKLKQEHQWR